MSDSVVRGIRDEIDAIDRSLIDGLNRRIEIVRHLHDYKVEHGLPLRDPGREESMVVELIASSSGPLSPEGIADFVHNVLDLTRREIHGD
ncbi:MAG: chorismate mutase [Actinomycetes bacterium]